MKTYFVHLKKTIDLRRNSARFIISTSNIPPKSYSLIDQVNSKNINLALDEYLLKIGIHLP